VGPRFRKVDNGSIIQLAESIHLSGLLQPIIINKDNMLIDGNHRLHAVKSLGWDEIDCIIKNIPELEADLIQIDTNLCRNDLSPLQQAIHIQKRSEILDILGKRKKLGDNQHNRVSHHATPTKTAKQISSEMGVSRGDYYRKLKLANDLSQHTKDKLIDSQWGTSTSALLQLAKEPNHIQNLVSDKLIETYNGRTISNLDRIIRTEIHSVKVSIDKNEILNYLEGYKNIQLNDTCQIYNDDFRNLSNTISNDSIDLIYTDPPYPKETIHLYEDLSKFSSEKLKDGCCCMAYCSVQILPQVLSLMSDHLTYYHTICISFRNGANARVGNIFNDWKPIVVFHKGTRPRHPQLSDKITSPDIDQYDKKLHRWAQPLHEPNYYISLLTKTSDVVMDPFLGTGTTGISSIQLGRRFIGVEINQNTFGMAEGRIKKVFKELQHQ
jgi:16S rRNA G966 N2-methylase RsmD